MKKNKFFSEALASLVVAVLVGTGCFFLTLWGLDLFWNGAWDMDVLNAIALFSAVSFGVISGMLRWNVKR